jgi:formate dehydrogenase major subunit
MADIHLRLEPGTNVALLNSLAAALVDEDLLDRAFVETPVRGLRRHTPASSHACLPEDMEAITGVAGVAGAARRATVRRRRASHAGARPGHDGALPGQRGGHAPVQPRAARRSGRSRGRGREPAARSEQRAGRRGHGLPAGPRPATSAWTTRPYSAKLRRRLGPAVPRARPADAAPDVRRRAPRRTEGDVHLRRGRRADRPRRHSRGRRPCARWTSWPCRRSSPRGRPRSRTWCCPAPASWRRTARSPTASVASSACGRCSTPSATPRPDWRMLCDLMAASRLSAASYHRGRPMIMDEIARVHPGFTGVSYPRLARNGLQWPVPSAEHPGTPILHRESFPLPGGKARLVCVEYRRALDTRRCAERRRPHAHHRAACSRTTTAAR